MPSQRCRFNTRLIIHSIIRVMLVLHTARSSDFLNGVLSTNFIEGYDLQHTI